MGHQLRGHLCPDETALGLQRLTGYDPHAALRVARRVHANSDAPGPLGGLAERVRVLETLLAGEPALNSTDSPAFRSAKQTLAREDG